MSSARQNIDPPSFTSSSVQGASASSMLPAMALDLAAKALMLTPRCSLAPPKNRQAERDSMEVVVPEPSIESDETAKIMKLATAPTSSIKPVVEPAANSGEVVEPAHVVGDVEPVGQMTLRVLEMTYVASSSATAPPVSPITVVEAPESV